MPFSILKSVSFWNRIYIYSENTVKWVREVEIWSAKLHKDFFDLVFEKNPALKNSLIESLVDYVAMVEEFTDLLLAEQNINRNEFDAIKKYLLWLFGNWFFRIISPYEDTRVVSLVKKYPELRNFDPNWWWEEFQDAIHNDEHKWLSVYGEDFDHKQILDLMASYQNRLDEWEISYSRLIQEDRDRYPLTLQCEIAKNYLLKLKNKWFGLARDEIIEKMKQKNSDLFVLWKYLKMIPFNKYRISNFIWIFLWDPKKDWVVDSSRRDILTDLAYTYTEETDDYDLLLDELEEIFADSKVDRFILDQLLQVWLLETYKSDLKKEE